MCPAKLRTALCIVILGALTCAGIAYSKAINKPNAGPLVSAPTLPAAAKNDGLELSAKLVQDKLLVNGDGVLTLALTLTAPAAATTTTGPQQNVDMVVVLDRSGSMSGKKIEDSRRAVLELIAHLAPGDRFGLVSYSDNVTRNAPLTAINDATRSQLMAAAAAIQPGGNTNLAAGLQEGIEVLRAGRAAADGQVRHGKIILISDGLANQGVTNPEAIAAMAGAASSQDFGVSALGVGSDFNELLMTRIADRGAGGYYFLEDPQRIAAVFLKESLETKTALARNIELRIPLPDGVQIQDAAGYPVEVAGNVALFRPGDLLPGKSRTLHVALRVPTSAENSYDIKGISAIYHNDGRPFGLTLDTPLHFSCVANPKAVAASIDKDSWERKALQEDYSKLKEQVAQDLRVGDEKGALSKIDSYKSEKKDANQAVGSVKVRDNLERDVAGLAATVKETFAAPAGQVEERQKLNAKALQQESYQQRRDKM